MEALLVWVKYQQGHGHTPQNVKQPYLKFRLGTNANVQMYLPPTSPLPNPKEGVIMIYTLRYKKKSKQFGFKSKKSLCSLKRFDKLLQSNDDTSWVS